MKQQRQRPCRAGIEPGSRSVQVECDSRHDLQHDVAHVTCIHKAKTLCRAQACLLASQPLQTLGSGPNHSH